MSLLILFIENLWELFSLEKFPIFNVESQFLLPKTKHLPCPRWEPYAALHWVSLPDIWLFSTLHPIPETYIDGAAHEGASLDCFLHDLVHVFGSILDLKKLRHSSCEVLHGLCSVPTFQSFIGTMEPWREDEDQSEVTRFQETWPGCYHCHQNFTLGSCDVLPSNSPTTL